VDSLRDSLRDLETSSAAKQLLNLRRTDEVEAAQGLATLSNSRGGNKKRGDKTGKASSINKRIHNVLEGITSRLQYVDNNLDNFSRTLTRKKKAAEVLFDFKGPGKRAVAKSRRRR
jgi:hypothetical protein